MADIDSEDLEDRFTAVFTGIEKAMEERYPSISQEGYETDAAYRADHETAKALFARGLRLSIHDDDLDDMAREALEWAAFYGVALEQFVADEIQNIHRLSVLLNGGSGADN